MRRSRKENIYILNDFFLFFNVDISRNTDPVNWDLSNKAQLFWQ